MSSVVSARYFCGTEGRRAAVRANAAFNGIDYVEVSADQLSIEVHFLKPAPGVDTLTFANFAIDGGVRVKRIRVTNAVRVAEVVRVTVDQPGDYSRYTLRLQKSESDADPPDAIDPQLSAIDFSFKIDCPSDFDCAENCDCPLHADEKIDIDYLAKDYESFRRVMLDRMALTLPEWRERNPADAGIAIVEMLAWVADNLSYEQDAVATEAYLGTARRRTSVRRHARLLDYVVDDGANARVWVCLTVTGDHDGNPLLAVGTQLATRMEGTAAVLDPNEFRADVAESAGALIFETREPVTKLRAAHNELRFYTWSSSACCLPKGSTAATLDGAYDDLAAGDVLVLREKRGPESGSELDADPSHAHAVRLTEVSVGIDPVTARDITHLTWHDDDRLPFPFCVSAETPAGAVPDVGVAHGNAVLADHGRTVRLPLETYSELLPPVPVPNPALARARHGSAACGNIDRVTAPLRYRPRLGHGPITQRARTYDPKRSAEAAMRWPRGDVLPHIQLEDEDGKLWLPQRELLGSDELKNEFVVETEDDGGAYIRFGDDRHGRRPDEGTSFRATYRVGGGSPGNVGARAIRHIATSLADTNVADGIVSVVNYTPARGGSEPESLADVRIKAPVAFRRQERAVTPSDYEEVATRHPDVQRAAATFRWTGSWYTVYLTVDRAGGRPLDPDFRTEMQRHIDRYRMAGYDVEIEAPHFVSIDLSLFVCVLPDFFRADVHRALLEALGSRIRPDGRPGFFHPDRFTFGQSVYLSQIIDAAHDVPGVQSVDVTVFRRRDFDDDGALETGELTIDRLEIARLDNDPNFPENGTLQVRLGGGR